MAPSYELSLIYRAMDKTQLAKTIRPLCEHLLQRGSIIRNVQTENNTDLPFRMRAHFEYHTQGRYAYLKFDASPEAMTSALDLCRLDQNLIRYNVFKQPDITKYSAGPRCKHMRKPTSAAAPKPAAAE
ncbi:uncharacterized protein MONBRDRAFT_22479 [Monosiga brevicollis MX1]|uniref:Ribosomal protein S6 n=1 Tax=Monosiga brevicollis TaxID=81824 RepID=A9UQQ0_MONBE|nr:uncharacterized protein MONBRDRAFT_22479 [Monosiga brevicollis MX1]EDQ93084.1 predicted protein [Monosiga brevicollis MX1]|eukprot:XP_001742846.1 hypothetical protein [Monosiga brevicollis MX1]